MDVLTALAATRLVIIVRFTSPGSGPSGGSDLAICDCSWQHPSIACAPLWRLAIVYLAGDIKGLHDQAGPAAGGEYRRRQIDDDDRDKWPR
ncbi:hypothetical protein ACFSQQ_00220 [Mesorhizobium kowhaii]|uniref:hypothetical protein n=1 Tax=Mesorhizobium kowhaii TaxID=1300272 RepID=UPI0035E4E289